MTWRRGLVLLACVVVLVASATEAAAYDPKETFARRTLVLSIEGGGGEQHNFDGHRVQTGLEFWNAGVRVGLVPFGPTLSGPLHGALEVGLEPYYQRYTSPVRAFFGGLGAVVRYHFLALGRVVPYFEAFGAAGGTDLEAREVDSNFTFLVQGGVGASFLVTDHAALYAGYRFQHVSNGNMADPNRGFESHTGVAGVSFFFR